MVEFVGADLLRRHVCTEPVKLAAPALRTLLQAPWMAPLKQPRITSTEAAVPGQEMVPPPALDIVMVSGKGPPGQVILTSLTVVFAPAQASSVEHRTLTPYWVVTSGAATKFALSV